MHSKRIIRIVIALLAVQSCLGLPARSSMFPMPDSARKTWGYIDHSGRYVIAPQFDSAHQFSCGAASVALDRDGCSDFNDLQYDYIDKDGKVISREPQSRDQQLHCGLYPRRNEFNWGYANAQGTFLIAPRFEEAAEFTNDLAPVTEKGVLEIVDTTGKIVWSQATANIKEMSTVNSGWVVIDVGTQTFYAWYQEHHLQFGGWFAPDEELVPASSKFMQNCYGYLNRKGQWAIPPQFSAAGNFSEGLASVSKQSDTTGHGFRELFIDKKGTTKLILPKSVRSAGEFREGIAWVYLDTTGTPFALRRKESSAACGFIDKAGNYVIKPEYSSLSGEFSEGLVAASIGTGENTRWGFIDKKQHVVIPFIFNSVQNFSEGMAAVCAVKEQIAQTIKPTAREVDTQIREQILQICRPYLLSSFRVQLDISNGAITRVTLRKGTGDSKVDAKLVSALERMKLPPWSSELGPDDNPNYLVTSKAVFAAFTSEDPDLEKIEEAKRVLEQSDIPQEHADWKDKASLLEKYLSLELQVDDVSWDSTCNQLVSLYRQHGDLKKAKDLAEFAFKRSVKNDSLVAEIAEEGGDFRLAESILKADIARFEKQNQGKLFETTVHSWHVAKAVALADFYYRQNRFQDAEVIYKKLANEHPYSLSENGEKIAASNLEQQYRRAVFYLDRGKIDVAEKLFMQLLKEADVVANKATLEDHYLNYLVLLKERYPQRFEKFAYLLERVQARNGGALFGVIDKNGRFIIPPKFEALGWLVDGMAPAKIGDRWGYVAAGGKWKIIPQFVVALPFAEQLAAVSGRLQPFPLFALDKQFANLAFIDNDGVCILQTTKNFSISDHSFFSDGLAGISINSGVNDGGYIDKSGKVTIAGQFHEVPSFIAGQAKPSIALSPVISTVLGVEQYEVIIRKDGTPLLRPQLNKPVRPAKDGELINPFAIPGGKSCDCVNGGQPGSAHKWGFQALDGTIVISPTFDWASCFAESVAAVLIKDHWGYIDRSGEIVLEPIYDMADDFIEGLAIVQDHNKTHFMNHSGHDPFDGKYNAVKPFSQDRAAVSEDGGTTYVLIDRGGRRVTETKFRRVGNYASGLAAVQPVNSTSNNWGYIDLNGHFVVPAILDEAQEFHGNFAVVRCQQNEANLGVVNSPSALAANASGKKVCIPAGCKIP